MGTAGPVCIRSLSENSTCVRSGHVCAKYTCHRGGAVLGVGARGRAVLGERGLFRFSFQFMAAALSLITISRRNRGESIHGGSRNELGPFS